jgi:hypothetical protein
MGLVQLVEVRQLEKSGQHKNDNCSPHFDQLSEKVTTVQKSKTSAIHVHL